MAFLIVKYFFSRFFWIMFLMPLTNWRRKEKIIKTNTAIYYFIIKQTIIIAFFFHGITIYPNVSSKYSDLALTLVA